MDFSQNGGFGEFTPNEGHLKMGNDVFKRALPLPTFLESARLGKCMAYLRDRQEATVGNYTANKYRKLISKPEILVPRSSKNGTLSTGVLYPVVAICIIIFIEISQCL